jgi:histidyl-tRNA synthetase
LTEDSINRIESNPLRILDDKIDGKKDFVKAAPKVDNFLTKQEIEYFDSIIKELKRQNIPLVIDPTMVRGLDYYTNFVFEINSNEKGLAGQPTLLGGGRYNNLVGRFASEDVGCIGFACGIERILVQLELERISLPEVDKVQVVIANLDESCNGTVIDIMNDLRKNSISVVCNFNTYKIRNHFNVADRLNCEQVIILGKKELENKKVLIKNQKTLKQEEVKISEIVNFLKGK